MQLSDALLLFALVAPVALILGYITAGLVSLWRHSLRLKREFQASLEALPKETLRQRLLGDPYLEELLPADDGVREFYTRLAAGEEVALAREYPKKRLYQLLGRAEYALRGSGGRPEVVDAITEISGLLQELARRSADSGRRLAES